MFSVRQKRAISDAVQKILRDTDHPELPIGEISFSLHVLGSSPMSWADIKNNGAVPNPDMNPWNEAQDKNSDSDPSSLAQPELGDDRQGAGAMSATHSGNR